ncbi:MAG: NAD(+) synthase [Chloroflexi bacterium]|nr:NAD(+) synthase [Chloroflexota bacterium]
MPAGTSFFNLYRHDLVRVAVAIPEVRVADPAFNAARTVEFMRKAADERAVVVLFPELGISAYSCDDLFHQRALLDGCLDGLASVVEASRELQLVAVVGLPLHLGHLLFNCAAVVSRGRILGIVPKMYLPNYREFYEARQFVAGEAATFDTVDLLGQQDIPFGSRVLFQCEEQPLLNIHVEICEDVWVPIPPSSYAAMEGATVLLNLSASPFTIGKAEFRRELVGGQSARCLSAYLYSAAGPGESTTDLAWDGHALIAENGNILAESERFSQTPRLLTSEIDLERLSQERMRQGSFGQSARIAAASGEPFERVTFSIDLPSDERLLPTRQYQRFPYVPSDPRTRDARSSEVFHIQVQGLAKRLKFAHLEKAIIGVSGGLDSTHALLVCAQAMDQLGLPRSNIMAYTMPGFATSDRTLAQAHRLMQAIGCTAQELDIRPSCLQMLRDIGHPFVDGQPVYDVTFENVQAGERTSHLFRLANFHNGLVVGTGDLSELALGWCTYGVGDHMSHYAVNASVPKTLIQHIIRWVAEVGELGEAASRTLVDVLETEISPELIPHTGAEDLGASQPSQSTEAKLGPYELHDFSLYYTLRFGYAPPKVAFLAYCAWRDRALGTWPGLPEERKRQYTLAEIKQHLNTFLWRFFQLSQFKRSCIPNGPKVGSGGSLSPRGDYRAPSDGESAAWLAQLSQIPDEA